MYLCMYSSIQKDLGIQEEKGRKKVGYGLKKRKRRIQKKGEDGLQE